MYAQQIADAFEVIPNVLASNCSFNSTEIISKLRKLHSEGKHTYGVNSFSTDDGFADNAAANVYEPLDLILNKLYTVFESCKMLLQVNQTIKAPRLQAVSQDLVNARRAIEDNEELAWSSWKHEMGKYFYFMKRMILCTFAVLINITKVNQVRICFCCINLI